MYKIKNISLLLLAVIATLVISCKDLDELNINPNGVDPAVADLNLLLPTIQTGVGKSIVSLGFGDLAGVMQHTQKDGWQSGHNDYDWDNLDANITNYSKRDMKQKGLSLEIDIDSYKHDITALVPICKDMKSQTELCPIYAKMRYQDIFTEKDLNHL